MSQITKRAMEQSLKKLLLKKPLNKITINDITEDCGISRMTFYYHFKDLYDLVEWVCMEDAKKAWADKDSYDGWQDGLLQFVLSMQENKAFVMNVHRSVHLEQVEAFLRPEVDKLILQIINEESGKDMVSEEDKKYISRAYSYVFIGTLFDWIKSDMQEEPRQVVHRLTLLVKGTVSHSFRRFAEKEPVSSI